MVFLRLMYMIVKGVKISRKFMFYFMIYAYSKLEGTKKEFVKHWEEKHHYVC
jgi:hypothetical protein